MRNAVIISFAAALSWLTASAQSPASALVLAPADLELTINLPNTAIFFSDSIPLGVALEGRRAVEAFDLETAWLYFQLKRFEDGKYAAREEQGWHRTLGGSYRYRVSRSGAQQVVSLEQTKLSLKPGDVLTRRFELNDLMREFTYPGKYWLCVSYEWQIKDSVQFTVPLVYSKTIPRLLDYMQYSNNAHGRISPFKVFTYLTGYDSKDIVVLPPVPLLRGWWSMHKDVILNVEAILNKKEYRNLDYNRRMIFVLKALESSDYDQRTDASEEFRNLTTVTLATPAPTDSEEMIERNAQSARRWWDQNKDLVMWINRVVIENQL